MNLKVFSIIPARSGSKGIKDKNIKILGDHPLFAWSIKASNNSNYISKTFVDTDSIEYAKIANNYGAEIPFLRPSKLSQDGSTDYEFITHFLDFLESVDDVPDLLVHLRPTTPFRNPKKIDDAINLTYSLLGSVSAIRSVHEMSETAYKTMEIDEDGFLISAFKKEKDLELLNAPRQGFPKTFSANGYVDILIPEKIKRNRKLHGNKVFGIVTEPVIEIDSTFDFSLCENILQSNDFDKDLIWG